MVPEIKKKAWAILSVCVGGRGFPKKYSKSKVFGSVFTYLKVADLYRLRLKICVDTTIGFVCFHCI